MVLFLLIAVSSIVAAIGLGACQAMANNRGGERQIAYCLAVVFAIFGALWGWYFFGYQSDESVAIRAGEVRAARMEAEVRSCESGIEAVQISRDFVKGRLRAPASAKFPSLRANGVTTHYLGDCEHEVWGYVDAQNAFGAQIRTSYYARLKNPGGAGRWRIVKLEM